MLLLPSGLRCSSLFREYMMSLNLKMTRKMTAWRRLQCACRRIAVVFAWVALLALALQWRRKGLCSFPSFFLIFK